MGGSHEPIIDTWRALWLRGHIQTRDVEPLLQVLLCRKAGDKTPVIVRITQDGSNATQPDFGATVCVEAGDDQHGIILDSKKSP
jgi:hypothetical protein